MIRGLVLGGLILLSGCLASAPSEPSIEPTPTASTPLAPAEALREDWEPEGWTIRGEGASMVCHDGSVGCHLRIQAPCCNDYTQVIKQLSVPLVGPVEVSFRFRAPTLSGADSEVSLSFSAESEMAFVLTGDIGKDMATLRVQDGPSRHFTPIGSWKPGETWYIARILVDASAGTIDAALLREDGSTMATAMPQPIPSGSTEIIAINLKMVRYSPGSTSVDFDAVLVRGIE